VVNDSADVLEVIPLDAGRRPKKLDSLLIGTTRRLVPTERSDRRLGRSATRVKGPRYPGASPWTTVYVNTAILNLILSGKWSHWRAYTKPPSLFRVVPSPIRFPTTSPSPKMGIPIPKARHYRAMSPFAKLLCPLALVSIMNRL